MIALPYLLIVLAIFTLGVITGGLSNVTSGGAGVLTIYVMTNFAGVLLQESTGTVLAASAGFVLIGVLTFFRRHQVDTRLGITLGLSGVAGAFFAARWASSVESVAMERAFGIFSLALAGYTSYLFLSQWKKDKDRSGIAELSTEASNSRPLGKTAALQMNAQSAVALRFSGTDPVSFAVQVAMGVLIGITTGLFGVGLASLSVVLIMLLFRLDTKMVLGTSLFASFFRYAGGSLGYLSAGQIDAFFFLVLVVGGGIGSVVGARIVLGNGIGSKDILIKMAQVAILLFIGYEFLLKYLI